MEKLITIYPHRSPYKDIFEDFNATLFHFNDGHWRKWQEYKEKYNFDATHWGFSGSFSYQNWTSMYVNVPESIELWTLRGTDFGLDTSLHYDDFLKILKGRGFVPPPFGTGLWLPEAFTEQGVYFEGELYVFSPIKPSTGKTYKTSQIVLQRSANFHNGQILGKLESLRPTEDLISPNTCRVVQKMTT